MKKLTTILIAAFGIMYIPLALGGPANKILAASTLSFHTNLGIQERTDLLVEASAKEQVVLIDGSPLSSLQRLRSIPYLTRALQVEQGSQMKARESCAAGYYEHQVFIRGKKFFESGCLTDPAFAVLSKSFRVLKSP